MTDVHATGLGCLVSQQTVGEQQYLVLERDDNVRGSHGGGFSFLRDVLRLTMNPEGLPGELNPVRPGTPTVIRHGNILLTFGYHLGDRTFLDGLRLFGRIENGEWSRLTSKPLHQKPEQLTAHEYADLLLGPEFSHSLLGPAKNYRLGRGAAELREAGLVSPRHFETFISGNSPQPA